MKRSNRNDREYTEVQYLKRENKRLKEQVRSLKRKTKQLERYSSLQTDEEPQKFEITVTKAVPCPECNKGSLSIVYVVGRCFYICDCCDYRSKSMKLE